MGPIRKTFRPMQGDGPESTERQALKILLPEIACVSVAAHLEAKARSLLPFWDLAGFNHAAVAVG